MKKGLLSLALVGCLSLTLTGCKGSLEDFEDQVDLLEELVEDGDIFEEDWKVIMNITADEGSQKNIVRKDGNMIYTLTQTMVDGEEMVEKMWTIEEDDGIHVYMESSNGVKDYYVISGEEEEGELVISEPENFLKNVYDMIISLDSELDDICELDGYTCSVEKKMFGKVILTATEEDGETIEATLKKGKLLEFSYEDEDGRYDFEIEYKDQDISKPNKADFE